MRGINPILAVMAWLLCLSTVAASPEDAVVRLDGCSGVCVSPDGLILTADHCGSDKFVNVTFPDGDKYRASLVYSPPQNGVDECQTYQIESVTDLPFAAIGKTPAAKGDRVWSVGYPFGNYQRNAGKVERLGFTVENSRRFQVKLADAVVTDWQSDGGNSGGPLFNAAGQVVGLLSMSSRDEPRSYWIGLESIRVAMANRKAAAGSRRLIMFGSKRCGDCKLYAREITATGANVLVINESDNHYDEWKRNYERHTGRTLDRYPTFWVENTAQARTEKYKPGLLQSILGWFGHTVRQIVVAFIGEPDQREVAPLPPRPEPNDQPPAPQEELDPANVTVVILAAMQDVGLVKGAALKIAIGKAEGPLSRAVNEKIGDKATLVVVPQRTKPEQFAAITSAARITADPAAVLVLIKAQSLGLKTLIAGKVEKMLVGKVPDSVPVELIFERIHKTDFASITRALVARETANYQRSTPSNAPAVTEDSIIAKMMPKMTQLIGDKLAASDNALIAKLGEKMTPETPPPQDGPDPVQTGLLGGGAAAWVTERLWSAWQRRKLAKQAAEIDRQAVAAKVPA